MFKITQISYATQFFYSKSYAFFHSGSLNDLMIECFHRKSHQLIHYLLNAAMCQVLLTLKTIFKNFFCLLDFIF